MRNCRFDVANAKKLMKEMSRVERRKFMLDVAAIEWKDYIANAHIPGLRKHVIMIVEKVLRSQPDVGKIFLLIQGTNQQAVNERLKNEIINSDLFKRLKGIYGSSYEIFMLSKLVPIVGHIEEDSLGMDEKLEKDMAEQVDVIVSCGASTRFDERYDVSMNTNTKGASELIKLARRCRKLQVFLHVSTEFVGSKVYANGGGRLWCRASIHGWQNVYSFTKAMGEMVIGTMSKDIPTVIVRPTAIGSTILDPFPGWIQGLRMADPMVVYYGKGQLNMFTAEGKSILDLVPADMVVNAILAAMARHGSSGAAGLTIYHIGTSSTNPLRWNEFFNYCYEHYLSFPLIDSQGKAAHMERMKLFDSLAAVTSYLSAGTNNACSTAVKGVHLLRKLSVVYEPYTNYKGWFDITNAKKLMKKMSLEERRDFMLNVAAIEWRDYIVNVHIHGLRKHNMLITGTTGFVGKLLIEKILRSQPDVGKLFLLIQGPNQEAVNERLKNEIINAELFKRLKGVHGISYEAFMLSKLVPVVARLGEDSLGMEEKVQKDIEDNVDVIVTCAANTKFDERYDVALNTNTNGASRLVKLARRCRKLKVFLHVSTGSI
ncbi:Fatty acyl-CoA reductase 6 [Nymphaea thermarum]|nr:Fatty acyl-CoA reductase 6 [Nymphaea thermarum]